MAKQEKKSDSHGEQKQGGKRVIAPDHSPFRREATGALFLFLGIFIILSYFSVDALFIGAFTSTLKGLLGVGFWMCAPIMFLCTFLLFFHQGKPVMQRVLCALGIPIAFSCFSYGLIHKDLRLPWTDFAALWAQGNEMNGCGVIGGVIGTLATTCFSNIGSIFVFLVTMIFLGMGVANRTVMDIIDWYAARPLYEPREITTGTVPKVKKVKRTLPPLEGEFELQDTIISKRKSRKGLRKIPLPPEEHQLEDKPKPSAPTSHLRVVATEKEIPVAKLKPAEGFEEHGPSGTDYTPPVIEEEHDSPLPMKHRPSVEMPNPLASAGESEPVTPSPDIFNQSTWESSLKRESIHVPEPVSSPATTLFEEAVDSGFFSVGQDLQDSQDFKMPNVDVPTPFSPLQSETSANPSGNTLLEPLQGSATAFFNKDKAVFSPDELFEGVPVQTPYPPLKNIVMESSHQEDQQIEPLVNLPVAEFPVARPSRVPVKLYSPLSSLENPDEAQVPSTVAHTDHNTKDFTTSVDIPPVWRAPVHEEETPVDFTANKTVPSAMGGDTPQQLSFDLPCTLSEEEPLHTSSAVVEFSLKDVPPVPEGTFIPPIDDQEDEFGDIHLWENQWYTDAPPREDVPQTAPTLDIIETWKQSKLPAPPVSVVEENFIETQQVPADTRYLEVGGEIQSPDPEEKSQEEKDKEAFAQLQRETFQQLQKEAIEKETLDRQKRAAYQREQEALERETQEALERETQEAFERETQEALDRETQEALERETQEALDRETQDALERETQEALEHETQEALEPITEIEQYASQDTPQGIYSRDDDSSLDEDSISDSPKEDILSHEKTSVRPKGLILTPIPKEQHVEEEEEEGEQEYQEELDDENPEEDKQTSSSGLGKGLELGLDPRLIAKALAVAEKLANASTFPFSLDDKFQDTEEKSSDNDEEPTVNYEEPTVSYEEPTVNYKEPTVSYEEPTVSYEEPTVSYDEPTISYEEPTISYDEPSVSYEEPTISYEEPTVSYEEPTVSYEEPTVSYEEPTVSYEEPTVSYDEPTVSYEEPTVSYEEPTISYEEPTISYDEPTVSYEEPTISYEEPTVSYDEPTISYDEPTVSYEEPTVSYDEPTISYEEPIVSYDEPTVSYDEPTISHKEPTISYEEPTVSYDEPTISYDEPTISYEEPTVSYKEPTISYDEPTISHEEPTISYQEPKASYEAPLPAPTQELNPPVQNMFGITAGDPVQQKPQASFDGRPDPSTGTMADKFPHERAETDFVLPKYKEELPPPVPAGYNNPANAVQGKIYQYPSLHLLHAATMSNVGEQRAELEENLQRLELTLQSFKIKATMKEVVQGPSVTRYEVELFQGEKLSKLVNLSDDIALSLGTSGVRIAPIDGKISTVGIEVPNKSVAAVEISQVLGSGAFKHAESKVSFAVGKDITGEAVVGDIAKMPHLLVAGTTGSGKSVCTNSLIISLLYKASPEDVRLIMVDPKMVELGIYNGIPHLLIPVVTDPKKAAGALQWAVYEMMQRYTKFSELGARDLSTYNAKAKVTDGYEPMAQIVVIIDELADLMLVAAKEVEESICRVAQMGRASGMHLIIATQRPSADVITGLMKANIPSRIAFAVSSGMDSRIILDVTGAEKLVGRGDMLYSPLGKGKPTRVQGCFITDSEVAAVVDYVKQEYGVATYSEEIMVEIDKNVASKEKGNQKDKAPIDLSSSQQDEMLYPAIDMIMETQKVSTSFLQRKLSLGYARAARIVDAIEDLGIIGTPDGGKTRTILISPEKWAEMKFRRGNAGEDIQNTPSDVPWETETEEGSF